MAIFCMPIMHMPLSSMYVIRQTKFMMTKIVYGSIMNRQLNSHSFVLSRGLRLPRTMYARSTRK